LSFKNNPDQFFVDQIERLRTNRNWQNAFQDTGRIQKLRNRLRTVPNKILFDAISSVIGDHKHAPTDGEIFAAIDALKPQSVPTFSSCRCEGCNDHGFGFLGGVVTACTCQAGRSLNPEEIAEKQKSYDNGRKLFELKLSSFPSLPYDPSERLA
jgi:hypothetical protein